MLNLDELKIESLAEISSGQYVYPNRTTAAVRVTHIPTGMVEECYTFKSQLYNRQECIKILEQRLKERLDA